MPGPAGLSAHRTAASRRRDRRSASGARSRRLPRSLASSLGDAARRAAAVRNVGVGAFVWVCEPGRRGIKCRCAGKTRFVRARRSPVVKPDSGPKWRSLLARHDWSSLCSIMRAAGSVERLRMLALLAEGTSSHADLKRLTGLQPGPLYHHLNCLRLAGLVRLESRDRYSATDSGRLVVLALLACSELLKRGR